MGISKTSEEKEENGKVILTPQFPTRALPPQSVQEPAFAILDKLNKKRGLLSNEDKQIITVENNLKAPKVKIEEYSNIYIYIHNLYLFRMETKPSVTKRRHSELKPSFSFGIQDDEYIRNSLSTKLWKKQSPSKYFEGQDTLGVGIASGVTGIDPLQSADFTQNNKSHFGAVSR